MCGTSSGLLICTRQRRVLRSRYSSFSPVRGSLKRECIRNLRFAQREEQSRIINRPSEVDCLLRSEVNISGDHLRQIFALTCIRRTVYLRSSERPFNSFVHLLYFPLLGPSFRGNFHTPRTIQIWMGYCYSPVTSSSEAHASSWCRNVRGIQTQTVPSSFRSRRESRDGQTTDDCRPSC